MAKLLPNSPILPTLPSGPDCNPPGGGRWTWDEAGRQWVSLDPAPVVADSVAEPVFEQVVAHLTE
jgi:hypothetical protein